MAGSVTTGENVLVDRYPYDEVEKALPVTLEFLKEHIQQTENWDDNLLAGMHGYIAGARDQIESMGQVALVEQTRKQFIGQEFMPYLEGSTIELSIRPVIEVTAIKYLDSADAEQTLSPSLYRVRTETSSVYFKSGLPTFAEGAGVLWIEYKAGHGQSWLSVPAKWANLVNIVAARRYDFRSGDGTNQQAAWDRMLRGLVTTSGDSSHRG